MKPIHSGTQRAALGSSGEKQKTMLRLPTFDESKAFFPDFRHRTLRHHAEGIFLTEKLFGVAVVNSDGCKSPSANVGEQHVREDLGRIPTAEDWLSQIRPQPWMDGRRLDNEALTTKNQQSRKCSSGNAGNDSVLAAR